MFFRLYEYQLSLPDGRYISLGNIKVFRLFDADDYFPILVKRNDKHIIAQAKQLEPEGTEALNDAGSWLLRLFDYYKEATISATDSITGENVLLLKRHETDKNRYRGRKFTFSFFNDTKFDYEGNWLRQLYFKLADTVKQRLFNRKLIS